MQVVQVDQEAAVAQVQTAAAPIAIQGQTIVATLTWVVEEYKDKDFQAVVELDTIAKAKIVTKQAVVAVLANPAGVQKTIVIKVYHKTAELEWPVTSWVTHSIGEAVAVAQFTTEIVKSLVAAELEVVADPHNIMAGRDIQAVNTVTVLAEAWH
jgi:hypothetical protein